MVNPPDLSGTDHGRPGAARPAAAAATDSVAAESLLVIAQHAARLAGEELTSRFGHAALLGTKSSVTDPVTEADRAAERTIRAVLNAARPTDGIVGEEDAVQVGTSGITWIVDPLDGTVNYLYGFEEWAVSIAAVDADGALAGVVYAPRFDQLYWATRGGGAWLGEQKLAARSTTELSQALVLIGLAYDATRRKEQFDEFGGLIDKVRDVRRGGSAALELCKVALGRADAYIDAPVMSWDVAAGALIAAEAGAISLIEERPLQRRHVAVTAPGVADALTAALLATDSGRATYATVRALFESQSAG